MLHIILFPLSFIYGIITFFRNKCYELKILKSTSFNIPIIGIGNLSVGGSGKTPHTEYLIDLLMSHQNICTLSRGYKRKTKGYVLSTEDSNTSDIGDEPMQIKSKYQKISFSFLTFITMCIVLKLELVF